MKAAKKNKAMVMAALPSSLAASGNQVDQYEHEQEPFDFRDRARESFQLVLFDGQADVRSCEHAVMGLSAGAGIVLTNRSV